MNCHELIREIRVIRGKRFNTNCTNHTNIGAWVSIREIRVIRGKRFNTNCTNHTNIGAWGSIREIRGICGKKIQHELHESHEYWGLD